MIVYDYYAVIGVAVACASSFVIVYVFTPFLIQWLKNKKLTVPNAHVAGNVMVFKRYVFDKNKLQTREDMKTTIGKFVF